jgi:hypothetical protein
MRIACWLPKTTNTHSEYLILIAFPLQQWSDERVSMLRYTYIACIVQFSLEESRGQTPRLGRFETVERALLNTETAVQLNGAWFIQRCKQGRCADRCP